MEKQLEDLLLNHLGELMQKQQSNMVWNERDVFTRKINAIYVLLEIDKKEKTTMERIRELRFN